MGGTIASELSIFVDESGSQKGHSKYCIVSYKRSEVPTPDAFIVRFKRDLVVFITKNLEYFQAFSKVKIYYDNGQQMVTEAFHGALDFMLSKNALLYRTADSREYLLSQVADCVCTLELTDLKFKSGEITETDAKVFGTNYGAFKTNHLKHFKRKVLGANS